MNSSCQFTRNQRLLTATHYQQVFAHPCKKSSQYFSVLARPNCLTYARLGLICARKHINTATARNRIKRLIRESFRHHQQELTGWDCVVLAKSGLEKISNQHLFNTLHQHWQFIPRRCKKFFS